MYRAIRQRQHGQPQHRQGLDPRQAEEGVAEWVKHQPDKSIIPSSVVRVPLSEDGGVDEAMQEEGRGHNDEKA